MTSFNLLNSKIQKFITNELKWNKLTDVQEHTIPHVMDGKNLIVLAPTAGGKTESVFLPLLSLVDNEKIDGISVLYISPIKALLNNQEIRLKRLSKAIYRDAFKWHGDISKPQKKKFYEQPCSILMITPESLEVILLNEKYDKDHLFRNLRFVVIDEIHSFADGDRGYHLISVIERLQTYSKFDIQRLGLSATIGNPEKIGVWLKGSSQRKGLVVDPGKKASNKRLNISFYQSENELMTKIYENFGNKKTIFFVNGRRDAEKLHSVIKEIIPSSYVHHSSMDKRYRNMAEEEFRLRNEPSCIICTSTMELGIDIGDLDTVLQLDSPSSVASFLQRIGRSGRRPGTISEMNFFVSDKESFIKTLVVKQLSSRGWVESVVVSQRAYHIYFHQILSVIIQEHGADRDYIFDLLSSVYCFSAINKDKYNKLLEYMKDEQLIEITGRNKVFLGIKGEKDFEYGNFKKLYSVFETMEEFMIKHNNRIIGSLQSWFIYSMGNKLHFYLSGQSWGVVDIDEESKIVYVEPSKKAELPVWAGQTALLTYEFCQEYLNIISTDEEIQSLPEHEQQVLFNIREDEKKKDIQKKEEFLIKKSPRNTAIITFAGDKVNYTIGLILRYLLKFERFEVNSFQFSVPTAVKFDDVVEVMKKLQKNPEYYLSPVMMMKYARFFPEVEYSKFKKYIPQEFSQEFLVDILLDVDKTKYLLKHFKLKTLEEYSK
jgi:ATP-dependent Lhr-like helicase